MSLRFADIALRPTRRGPTSARMKSVPSMSMSVVTNSAREGDVIAAQSSPGLISTRELAGVCARSQSMKSNSPGMGLWVGVWAQVMYARLGLQRKRLHAIAPPSQVLRGRPVTLAVRLPARVPLRAKLRAARRRLALASGLLCAAALVFAAGELYLRAAPPDDLAKYLPESDQSGPFRADTRFGVQYRSLDALAADNPGRFAPYRPLFNNPNARPTWAFFGSSFVQAPGMLADTSRELVPQRVTFNLGKNEDFPVRLAQAALLLECGLKPERIFLVCIPLDLNHFILHGLDQYRATETGALVYAPRLPSIGGTLMKHSRLALKGWTRTTLHLNRPFFAASELYQRVDPVVRADVQTVFASFAEVAAKHRVPVTVVLLPSYDQVCRGAGFAVQDALAEDSRAVGFDVCDVREAFRAWPNKAELFIPDKHFSATGNRLLLATIVGHLKVTEIGRA